MPRLWNSCPDPKIPALTLKFPAGPSCIDQEPKPRILTHLSSFSLHGMPVPALPSQPDRGLTNSHLQHRLNPGSFTSRSQGRGEKYHPQKFCISLPYNTGSETLFGFGGKDFPSRAPALLDCSKPTSCFSSDRVRYDSWLGEPLLNEKMLLKLTHSTLTPKPKGRVKWKFAGVISQAFCWIPFVVGVRLRSVK